MARKKLLCTDLDGTFIGEDSSMYELVRLLEGSDLLLAFDTGRHLPSVRGFVEEKGLRLPEASICMVGTEVFVLRDNELVLDEGWSDLISEGWDKKRISELLEDLEEVSIQDEEWQTRFKASYFLRERVEEVREEIDKRMAKEQLEATVVYSASAFLDFLPKKSGKAKATEYLAQTYDIAQEDVVVAGDSGNDLDLFEYGFQGIIVGNSHPELKAFKGPKAYHAKGGYSAGIIEGLRHFGFL